MQALTTILLVLFLLSPFALIIYFALRYQRRMLAQSWENILNIFEENKIRVTSKIPEKTTVIPDVYGDTSAYQVRVYSYYVGTGKSRSLITSAVFSLKQTHLPDFTLSRENIFTKAGESLGIKDIKTGDHEFDKTYRLHSANESAVLPFFNDQLISVLNENKKSFYGKYESKGNSFTLSYYGMPGFKIGYKYFQTLFQLALVILKNGNSSTAGPPLK